MNCEHVEALLYDYATNCLDALDRSSVDAHLKTCGNCRENLRLLQETLPVLDTWQPPQLPPDLADRIAKDALRFQMPWWQRALQRITLPSRFMLPMQAVAVACLALVIFMGIPSKDNDIISRGGFTIEMKPTGAATPIQLKVANVQAAMDELKELVEKFGGRIRRHRNVAVVVGFSIDPNQEPQFFDALNEIGVLTKPAKGYQAEDGTLVLLIAE